MNISRQPRKHLAWRRLGGALLLLSLTAGLAQSAVTNVVRMQNFSFSPRLLTNQVGDTVIWTNTTLTLHSVVSSNVPGAWPEPTTFTSPKCFTNRFTAAGVYGYFCRPHQLSGMNGIIYVQPPPNQRPAVTLSNPLDGITLAAPATLTLGAVATDPDGDGTITNVQFYSGTTLLGATTSRPYALVVSSLAAQAAPYSFTVRAFDNGGLIATSSPPVSVSVVTPGAVKFDDTSLTPVNGQFPLRLLSVTPGLRYEIDWSGTFTNWVLFTNFLASSTTTNFTTPATGGNRFFKAWLLPNP
jgi:plastocyanin